MPPRDTKPRCPWVKLSNPMYVKYHDKEWGRPVHDDPTLFEMLILEGAQAGLSWETVLAKRDNYRRAFAQFDPKKVARFTAKKEQALLANPGIVRNRLKIASTITNAQAFLKVQHEFGTFDSYLWSFVNHTPIVSRFKTFQNYPTRTAISDSLSRDLTTRGFRFVGSTIIYAYMQAVGLANDHASDCFLAK